MEDHRFDLIARAQSAAGSRRQGLKLLAGGLLGGVLTRLGRAEAGAACRTFNKPCDNKRRCCKGVGLRCVDGRCRCRNNYDRCTAGPGCQNLERDSDHCGKCDKKCPASKPCCLNGECRPKCGDVCCADCFLTVKGDGLPPDPNSAECCAAVGGEVCSRRPGSDDDRCCFPQDKCLKGRCCHDSLFGETRCAGTCCRQAACCNGKTCCKAGQVCATKTEGSPVQSCASANRSCANDPQCYPNEECRGGICCSGVRRCYDLETKDPVCCSATEYCQFADIPDNARCVPVHTSQSTYRSYRVRP